MKIVIRRMRPDEMGFVIGTWSSSLRRSLYAGLVSLKTWSRVMKPEIAEILGRPGVRVMVLADADSKDRETDLIGHIVWQPSERPLVFYIYVKQLYRAQGFARQLLEAAGIGPDGAFDYVCRTYATDKLTEAGKLARAEWHPLLGRGAEENAA